MRAVWMVGRAKLRQRRGTTAALALLAALAGGIVLTLVAGASRTASAMDRFVAFSRPEDVYVSVNGPQVGGNAGQPPPEVTQQQLDAYVAAVGRDRAGVAALPEVAEVGRAPYIDLAPDRAGRQVGHVNPFAPADAHAFRTLDRPRLLRGRLARPDRSEEAVVDDVSAQLRHLRVGSRLTMWSYAPDQNPFDVPAIGQPPAPTGPSYTFRVVGVVRDAATLNAPPVAVTRDAVYDSEGGLYLTPAFLRRFAKDQGVPVETLPGIEGLRLRLRHGLADLPALRRDVARFDVSPGDIHVGSDILAAAQRARRATGLEATALLLAAGVAAIAALLVLGQALSRQVQADAVDNRSVAALGLGPRHLALVAMVRASVVAVTGAAGAVVVAIAASPLMPVGLARRAEIHPGLSANIAVLAAGGAAVALAVAVRALVPAWRSATTTSSQGPITAARRIGGVTSGAVAATAVAVTGVVAALTVGGSLLHLVHSPAEQGWTWDVVVGNPNEASALSDDPEADTVRRQMTDLLARDHDVGAFAGLTGADVTVDRRPVSVTGVDPIRGSVRQRFPHGRSPAAADEIALGTDVLRQLHRHVGQRVTVSSGRATRTMRIVGVPLQPTAGGLNTRLSGGGVLTGNGLRALVPGVATVQFAVRFRPGIDEQAATRSLLQTFGPVVLTPYVGGEVGDLARVDFLPSLVAGLLVLLGLGGLSLTLIGGVRRHRHDFAVLKALGGVRRQVAATVMQSAVVAAVAAVAIGLPGGLALGRWTWRLVADSVGSEAATRVPLVAVLVVGPATVAVAAALAIGPAWAATRVPTAQALRAE